MTTRFALTECRPVLKPSVSKARRDKRDLAAAKPTEPAERRRHAGSCSPDRQLRRGYGRAGGGFFNYTMKSGTIRSTGGFRLFVNGHSMQARRSQIEAASAMSFEQGSISEHAAQE
jgi:hypothetical protein